LLHDHGIQLQLLLRPLHDLLLNRALGDKTVNVDGPLLPDAMGAILGLEISLKGGREGARWKG